MFEVGTIYSNYLNKTIIKLKGKLTYFIHFDLNTNIFHNQEHNLKESHFFYHLNIFTI